MLSPRTFSNRGQALIVLGLVVYLLLIAITGAFGSLAAQPQSVWELLEIEDLVPHVGQLGIAAAWVGLLFIPVGVLLARVVRRGSSNTETRKRAPGELVTVADEESAPGQYRMAQTRHSKSDRADVAGATKSWKRGLLRFAFVVGLTTALAWLGVLAAHRTFRPNPFAMIHLATATGGGLLGAWIGWMWWGDRRSRRWLAVQMIALAGGGVAAVVFAIALMLDSQPWDLDPVRVTSDEKRRLARLVSESDGPDGARELSLDEHDLNVLVSWFLNLGPGDHAGRVILDGSGPQLHASLSLGGLPGRSAGNRRWYLNAAASGKLTVEDGELQLSVSRLSVGRLALPWPLLTAASRLAGWSLQNDPEVREALAEIKTLRISETNAMLVTHPDVTEDGGHRRPTKEILRNLADRMRGDSISTERVRAYVRHLAELMERTPPEQGDIPTYFSEAFRLARQRSRDGQAVEENRAALLALAILFGHRRVEDGVGRVSDLLPPSAGAHARQAVMRGRRDWTQHFLVSSAITVVSSHLVSDALGLLKEELDADRGSGFSFSDLLADRAGTRLATVATRNEASARRIQQLLGQPFPIDFILPPAADLPEGISDAQLQRDYGGVGGDGYNAVVEAIERRLDGCAALAVR